MNRNGKYKCMNIDQQNNLNIAIQGVYDASITLKIIKPEVHFAEAVDFPNPEITSV